MRVAAESLLPGAIAQHQHRRAAARVVRCAQGSTEQGSRAQHVEEVARHEGAAQLRDLVSFPNRQRQGAKGGQERDSLERSGAPRELAGVVEPQRIGEFLVGQLSPQHNKAVLIADGELAQEQRVGHREHRRREANAEGEGEDRDSGELWRVLQGPQGVAHVSQHLRFSYRGLENSLTSRDVD